LGPFAIPFECFIPEKVTVFCRPKEHLASRLANGATRLQPSTLLMGQAAGGAIAALAIQNNMQPRAL